MKEMRRLAYLCTGRAFAFAALGIAVAMIGFSFDLLLATRVGAILFSILALAFVLKARMAPSDDYKRTELWVVLPPELRPPESYAGWTLGSVRREAFYAFARHAGWTAGGLWVLSILLWLVRGST